jgi:hypothetical protein
MELDEYLARHGVTRADLEFHVRSIVEPSDIAFLSGSLVEGCGTRFSDVDIYIFRAGEPTGVPRIETHRLGPVALDVEWWSLADVDRIIATLAALRSDGARDPHQALRLSIPERELLHRIRVGSPVHATARFVELQRGIDARALSRLLFDRTTILLNNAQLDVLGFLDERDPWGAWVVYQRLIGAVVDAYLYARGSTRTEEKWRFRSLRELPAHRGWFPGGQAERLPDQLEALFAIPSIDLETFRPRVSRAVALANRVVPWGQLKFSDAAFEPTKRNVDRENKGGPVLPRIASSMKIRAVDQSILAFDASGSFRKEINFLSLEALALFDGNTRLDDVVGSLMAYTPAGPGEVAQGVRDLVTLLDDAELVEWTTLPGSHANAT